MNNAFAAFDLGASSGRLILGTLKNGKLELEEVHRFKNGPIKLRNSLYLDFLNLIEEMKTGLKMLSKRNDIKLLGIGIDTWGVDYGWLDESGNLYNNPHHYRDGRTSEVIETVHNLISDSELYNETGIKHFPFNTIYQLYYDIHINKVLEKGASQFLFMPNLFEYFLTGNRVWEKTIASTGSLLNSCTKSWSDKIFKKLEIPYSLVGELVNPGTMNGILSDEIQKEVGLEGIPVYSIGGHDSASAIIGTPLNNDGLFLISGTWSLFGIESEKSYTDKLSMNKGFTNELGLNSTRYHKLITGLWIIQELRKQWNSKGLNLEFEDIVKEVEKSESNFTINPNDNRFNFSLDMEQSIKDYCLETNQGEPSTIGEIAKAVYNGITEIYVEALTDLELITGKKYTSINMVGGGIQDRYLCQLTANKLKIKVSTGPIEASVIGNIICQMISTGIVKNIKEGREIIKRSFSIKEYLSE